MVERFVYIENHVTLHVKSNTEKMNCMETEKSLLG